MPWVVLVGRLLPVLACLGCRRPLVSGWLLLLALVAQVRGAWLAVTNLMLSFVYGQGCPGPSRLSRKDRIGKGKKCEKRVYPSTAGTAQQRPRVKEYKASMCACISGQRMHSLGHYIWTTNTEQRITDPLKFIRLASQARLTTQTTYMHRNIVHARLTHLLLECALWIELQLRRRP